MIVQPGYDGEYLGIIKMIWEDDRFSFDHEFLPIGESLTPTPLVLERIQLFHQRMKEKK
jgi:hypothetical protein